MVSSSPPPPVELNFQTLPSMWSAYRRLLTVRRYVWPGRRPRLHPIHVRLDAVRPSRDRLVRYCSLCELPEGRTLPITFPHILAAPLHAQVLAQPMFPFPSMGLVHTFNTIESMAVIPDQATLSVDVTLREMRRQRRGYEFDLVTEMSTEGQVVWRETTTALARKALGGKKRRRKRVSRWIAEDDTLIYDTRWQVPQDMGRRYAAVSGDFNPIHLTWWSARIFGFRKAIVHGMWTVGRCVAELERLQPIQQGRLKVAFKRPLLLPSEVVFRAYRNTSGRLRFTVHRASDEVPHVRGDFVATD